MAKCKVCKTNIPDGKEYCSSCQDKEQIKSNESYLDSLLNSVKNTAPTADSIYKKKNISSINGINTASTSDSNAKFLEKVDVSDFEENSTYTVDLGDIKDFDSYLDDTDVDFNHDDIDINIDADFDNDVDIDVDFDNDVDLDVDLDAEFNHDDIDIDVDADFDNDFDLKGNAKRNDNSTNNSTNNSIDNDFTDQDNNFGIPEEELFGDSLTNLLSYDENIVSREEQSEPTGYDERSYSADLYEEKQTENEGNNNKPIDNLDSEVAVTMELNPEELGEEEQMKNDDKLDINSETLEDDNLFTPYDMSEFEEDFDPDLNDLLHSLDHMEEDSPVEQDSTAFDVSTTELHTNGSQLFEENEPEDDDFLSLLNQISSDDPVAEDVKAINSLLNGSSVEVKDRSTAPSDVGEVFSDALKVVTSLNDNEINEAEFLKDKPNTKEKKEKRKSSKKQKETKETSDKPKISFWKRLFGNVKNENPTGEKPKKAQEEDSQEPKKAAKKSKPPKGKKGTAATSEDDNKSDNSKDKKKEGKKEKKVKQKKQKEIIQVIDEIDEDEGRINRVGAFIVFVFFGLLALLLYVGTNVVSYTLSIQNATNYFDNNKYTEAYNEVYGIEFKDEDIELYDKIMTVMFVNKQLNSYNNYYTIGKYPEALDSLLKGLKRYDKYIELATMLGIEYDMNYVREQILAELELVFHISEKEATKINSFDSISEYSLEVYDVVLENMSN